MTASPAATHPFQSLVVAKISIDNPDGLVEVADAIWVKTDDGRVVRIDQHTNRVTWSVKLDTARDRNHYCQGIGTDGTGVWACVASDTGTGIVRIDPKTLTTGKTVAVNKVFDQLTLPHTGRGLWVLSGAGDTVTVVDPTHRTTTSYPLGVRCQQLAASEQIVVVTCPNADTLLALEPTSGRIRGHLHLPQPRTVTIAQDSIWVDTANGLMRLDASLITRAVYPNQRVGFEGDLAPTHDSLWVRTPGCVLWRLDPNRNTVTEQLIPDIALSAGSLLVTADALWVSANNEGIILRLRR